MIKYTGSGVSLAPGAILTWTLVHQRTSLRQFLTAASTTAYLAQLLAAPWYMRSTLVTGNPIYLLIGGGQGWNEMVARWLLVIGQRMDILDLANVPWTHIGPSAQGTMSFDATYSPASLASLSPLLVVRRRGRSPVETLLALAAGNLRWLESHAAYYATCVLRGRQPLWIFTPLSLLCAFALKGIAE